MTAEQKTLLVVDDEETIHRALHRTLRREPYTLLHAYDAAEAWAMLKQHPEIEGIICDHYMPGTRGLDLLIEVRAKLPSVVTVLLTAQADLQLVIDAINQGHVHQFVTKPWNSMALRVRLRELLFAEDPEAVTEQDAAKAASKLSEDLLPMQDETTGAYIIEGPPEK